MRTGFCIPEHASENDAPETCERLARYYLSALLLFERAVGEFRIQPLPIPFITAMTTGAIKAAIRPYSMAVVALSDVRDSAAPWAEPYVEIGFVLANL